VWCNDCLAHLELTAVEQALLGVHKTVLQGCC